MNYRSLFAGILLAAGLLVNPSVQSEAAFSQDMDISQNGIEFICSLEGFNSKCYWDYSQSSIGYGTKCTGSSVQPHSSGMHSITKEDAMKAMRSGIQTTYMPKVRNQTSGLNLTQNQFDALVSLAYNCGGGLNRIYNCPLTKYLRGELTASDARNQYGNYLVYAGGSYLQGLHNRRVKEANLFFTEEVMQKPTTASISVQNQRMLFTTAEEVIFTMNSDYGMTYYLGIDYEGERLFTPKVENGNIYTHTFDQPGHYSVYVSAYNSYGYADSPRIEFDVAAPEDDPQTGPAPSTANVSVQDDRTLFMTTEEVIFTISSDYGTTYYLGIDYDGKRLLTSKAEDDLYTHTFDRPGHYSVYVSAYNSQGYIDSPYIEFNVIEPGDINADFQIDTNDLILFRDYLQNKLTFSKYQTEVADLNHDGICNIFDFIALKQKLLSAE